MVYPKSVKIITFPKIEDKKNELRGVIIKITIKKTETAKQEHTVWVDFAYSIINVEEDEVIKIYLYFIFVYL